MTLRPFRLACIVLVLGVATVPVTFAQAAGDDSTLLLGPLTLRPVLVLKDAGIDSNVFNEPGSGREDRTATLTGATDARLRVGLVQFDAAGSVDYLYFQRYTQERALNRFGSLRVQPQFSRLRPFAGGAYRRTRDRANSEIDVRVPRTEYEYSAGLDAQLTTRGLLHAVVRRSHWRFDEGEQFRGADLATRLNRHSDLIQAAFRYELSPLTTFTVETGLSRDRFTASPDRDTDLWQTSAGFLFAPDAVIRGRALVGFRDLRARGATAVPSRGPTAGVELSYTLLDRTVISGRLLHETTVSVESHPYYLSTLGAVEVRHNLLGPLDIVGRMGRERLDYQALPAFALPGHLDRVNTVGGGVAVRLGPHTRLSVEYEEIERRSDPLANREYDRRRVFTTVSYGF